MIIHKLTLLAIISLERINKKKVKTQVSDLEIYRYFPCESTAKQYKDKTKKYNFCANSIRYSASTAYIHPFFAAKLCKEKQNSVNLQ